MKRRLTLLVLAVVVLVAACGSSGAPESFEEQKGSLPEELVPFAQQLIGTADPGDVPLVQRNFLEGCMFDGIPRLDGLSGADLARACGCSYDGIVSFLIENPPPTSTAFETFVELDESLQVEGSTLSSQYVRIVDDCRAQA